MFAYIKRNIMDKLFREINKIAKEWYEKEYIIISDADGYKGCFGHSDNFDYKELKPHKTLKGLLEKMIKYQNEYCVWQIEHDISGLSQLHSFLSPLSEDGSVYLGEGMYLDSSGNIIEQD